MTPRLDEAVTAILPSHVIIYKNLWSTINRCTELPLDTAINYPCCESLLCHIHALTTSTLLWILCACEM